MWLDEWVIMIRRNDMFLKEERYDDKVYNLHEAMAIIKDLRKRPDIYSVFARPAEEVK